MVDGADSSAPSRTAATLPRPRSTAASSLSHLIFTCSSTTSSGSHMAVTAASCCPTSSAPQTLSAADIVSLLPPGFRHQCNEVILRMLAAAFLVFSSILSAVWCQSNMKVSVPKTLNATSGSCLLMPCLFTISKDKEAFLDNSPVVTWRRGSLWSLYDTDRFTNTQRQMEPLMKVVGDLRMNNCTSVMMNLTSLHSDRYFFKLQTEGFSVTETKAVHINVSGTGGFVTGTGGEDEKVSQFHWKTADSYFFS